MSGRLCHEAQGQAPRTATRVIAIDGPASSGKSTLARALAEHLGVARLDTGAMYRAVAYCALARGIDPGDDPAVAALARGLVLDLGERLRVDGTDATDAIRTPEVDAAVSVVAANPEVRAEMVARQRAWVAHHGGGVVEGRDIGTVVLPDAQLKIYLTASTDERARRRALERAGDDLGAVAKALARRDRLDSTRAASPLPAPQDMAADAVVIDSTGRDAAEVLGEVLGWL
ncbi:MAG: (d)CMP kinase [Acidimicrobiales bacterium]